MKQFNLDTNCILSLFIIIHQILILKSGSNIFWNSRHLKEVQIKKPKNIQVNLWYISNYSTNATFSFAFAIHNKARLWQRLNMLKVTSQSII